MMIIKVSIVSRNGKSHVTINDISTSCNALNVKIDMQYPNMAAVVTNTINRVVNANRRSFKDSMYTGFEGYAVDILKSILMPILDGVACQDFFNYNKLS